MGEVIDLDAYRSQHAIAPPAAPPAFFFDLSCPFSYLAAERVERVLGNVEWVPAAGEALRDPSEWESAEAIRAHAETCALALRIPLVWPDRFPEPTPAALRAASYATEIGRGARFALAASRLAFCGGFDLEDPEILAEAAAAAGIALRDCLDAAGDTSRDEAVTATAGKLRFSGVRALPAVRVGSSWFDGDGALAAASGLLRARGMCDGPAVG